MDKLLEHEASRVSFVGGLRVCSCWFLVVPPWRPFHNTSGSFTSVLYCLRCFVVVRVWSVTAHRGDMGGRVNNYSVLIELYGEIGTLGK